MSHAPAVSRPAHAPDPARTPDPAPAAPQPQVGTSASFHDSERTRLTPQHPPVSAPERPERPEPAPAAEVVVTPRPAAEEVVTPRPAAEEVVTPRPAAEPVAAGPLAGPPAAAELVAPASEIPAARPEPADSPAEEQARPRAGKKNPRGRRASVPSWDEIMLGSSRQRD